MSIFQATASAPVNIACIKCILGQARHKLILPTNSSLSDRLWLNGKEEEINEGGRMATCIAEMKRLRKQEVEDKKPNEPKLSALSVHIASFNNFPTAAGLASSASGFAALVSSLAQLYALPVSPSTLSLISRQGSGSACRSLFGGFVAPQSHWPDIHALICVVSDDKKGTSSTSGMQRTVETSALLQHRIKNVVPQRMSDISKAILDRDFDTFARITMADSNQFHAVALDTEPPIFYMNDVSRAIIALIVEYNRISLANGGKRKAAYTYDAGPNAVIYTPSENVKEIIQLIVTYFPQKEGSFKDVFGLFAGSDVNGAAKVVDGFNEAVAKRFEVGAVKGLIHTRVGDGPRALGNNEALLGADGFPKTLA
ncbi:Diphosphomevalonate decarboxylase [Infundibulicybe gibba]|nr:Diphosphomevalonate decarboxylase [Infundibulicybe gibba]